MTQVICQIFLVQLHVQTKYIFLLSFSFILFSLKFVVLMHIQSIATPENNNAPSHKSFILELNSKDITAAIHSMQFTSNFLSFPSFFYILITIIFYTYNNQLQLFLLSRLVLKQIYLPLQVLPLLQQHHLDLLGLCLEMMTILCSVNWIIIIILIIPQ